MGARGGAQRRSRSPLGPLNCAHNRTLLRFSPAPRPPRTLPPSLPGQQPPPSRRAPHHPPCASLQQRPLAPNPAPSPTHHHGGRDGDLRLP